MGSGKRGRADKNIIQAEVGGDGRAVDITELDMLAGEGRRAWHRQHSQVAAAIGPQVVAPEIEAMAVWEESGVEL